MIERIEHEGVVLAIIIPAGHKAKGIEFFTEDSFSQQLGYMSRPEGYVVTPHIHLPAKREVVYTQEVLFIRKGSLIVDFYDEYETYLQSRKLAEGDCILLARGGHGFEMLEDCEIIEVKQGPYMKNDKRRFLDTR
jgi:hypothetical protein